MSLSRRLDRADQADLARRVRIFLQNQPHPEVQKLAVDVRHDEVLIRGQVGSAYARQLATDCCARVAGVRRVVNETEIAG